MDDFFNAIAQFIVDNNLIFKRHSILYMIPCVITVFSFIVHFRRAVIKSPYLFTKVFCQFIVFGLLFENIGNIKYIIDVWNKEKFIDGVNIMWVLIMLISGIIQLAAPLFIKAAEKFYLNKLNENEFRKY
ncbi:hypothetical protein PL373_04125 [Tenacibaculum maritimum]|nr:hypothetical protein [Tenacibaculum maritimum]MDB0600342.1 hypothetical protein [Tenacibaculum maritimum]MDB0611142.1 hypothetical protein [Tenacibaculum maritimum]